MGTETHKYRVVDDSKTVEDNLSKEEADYFVSFLFCERGISNLTVEKYYPEAHRLGRDPDIH